MRISGQCSVSCNNKIYSVVVMGIGLWTFIQSDDLDLVLWLWMTHRIQVCENFIYGHHRTCIVPGYDVLPCLKTFCHRKRLRALVLSGVVIASLRNIELENEIKDIRKMKL